MKKIIYTAMMLGVAFNTFAMKRPASLSHADGGRLSLAGVRAESSTEADRILAQLHDNDARVPETLEELKNAITHQVRCGQRVKRALLTNGKTVEAEELGEQIGAIKELRDTSLAERNLGDIHRVSNLVESVWLLQAQLASYQEMLDQKRVSDALNVIKQPKAGQRQKLKVGEKRAVSSVFEGHNEDDELEPYHVASSAFAGAEPLNKRRKLEEVPYPLPSRSVLPSSSYALVAHKEETSSSAFGARKRPSVSTSSSTTTESTTKETEIQQVRREISEMQGAISSKIREAETYRKYAERLNNAYLSLLYQAGNTGLDLGLQSVQDTNLGYQQWDNQMAKVKTALNAGVLRTTQVELLWGQYQTVQAQSRMVDEYLEQVKQDVIGYREACQGAAERLKECADETTGAANAQVQRNGGAWLRQVQKEEPKGLLGGLLDGVKGIFDGVTGFFGR